MALGRHFFKGTQFERGMIATAFFLAVSLQFVTGTTAQTPARRQEDSQVSKTPLRPKLVVVLVVDQMRADYVDKFRGQWTGGLKRLVEQGAWFSDAAYPYAATETCVGHATISTGAFPATHGMIANEWWDRDQQKGVTCTSDSSVKNVGYGGASVKGGDSAGKMLMPAFADELKFQMGGASRVVAFSLKARAAIMLGGRQGDAVTWFDAAAGSWTTSSAYPTAAFVEEYAKTHPVAGDYGKTWAPTLPNAEYLYDETSTGAVPPAGFGAAFPHPLRGKPDSKGADTAFYSQWETSPYADIYLEQMAEAAVDKLDLGKRGATDFLGVGFSSVDYVGHAFGPRSREVQDILVQLDWALGQLFAHLDQAVGRDNYVVALSADHGVVPIPEDMKKAGMDAGWLNVEQVQDRIEKTLEKLNYAKPAVAEVGGSDVYFRPGTYEKLKSDPSAMRAVIEAIQSVPGVAHVYRAEELEDRPATKSPIRTAEANGFLKARSGDLIVVPKPYWPWDYSMPGKTRQYGTTHGAPYDYDQRVPVLLMGWGIQSGEFHETITPADIAPTLASLCGITIALRDGRVLAEALKKPGAGAASAKTVSKIIPTSNP